MSTNLSIKPLINEESESACIHLSKLSWERSIAFLEEYVYDIGTGLNISQTVLTRLILIDVLYVCAYVYRQWYVTLLLSSIFLYVAGRDFIHIREVLQMTSGERKCWNITILEDSISEGQQTHFVGVELFYIYLRPLRASVRSASARVYIRDNDRGMCSS